ncbi:protein of unknown function [Streptomyces murinus]
MPTTGARVAARLPPGPDTPAHRTVTTYHHVAPRRPLGQPVRPVGTRPPRAGHPRPQPCTDTGACPEAAPGRRGEPRRRTVPRRRAQADSRTTRSVESTT